MSGEVNIFPPHRRLYSKRATATEAVENVAHVHLYCIDKQAATAGSQLLWRLAVLCAQDDAQIETKKHAQAPCNPA